MATVVWRNKDSHNIVLHNSKLPNLSFGYIVEYVINYLTSGTWVWSFVYVVYVGDVGFWIEFAMAACISVAIVL